MAAQGSQEHAAGFYSFSSFPLALPHPPSPPLTSPILSPPSPLQRVCSQLFSCTYFAAQRHLYAHKIWSALLTYGESTDLENPSLGRRMRVTLQSGPGPFMADDPYKWTQLKSSGIANTGTRWNLRTVGLACLLSNGNQPEILKSDLFSPDDPTSHYSFPGGQEVIGIDL